jgi:hypothetical protein
MLCCVPVLFDQQAYHSPFDSLVVVSLALQALHSIPIHIQTLNMHQRISVAVAQVTANTRYAFKQ